MTDELLCKYPNFDNICWNSIPMNMTRTSTILAGVLILFVGYVIGKFFTVAGIQGGNLTLTVIDLIFMILAVASSVLSIVAIVFTWIFYKNSQTLNQEAIKVLSDITQKISKVDEIITKQFDKLLSKVIGADYEGEVPLGDIQLSSRSANRIRENRRRTKDNKQ